MSKFLTTGLLVGAVLFIPAIPGTATPPVQDPGEPARKVARVICCEALLPPNGPQGKPLPLVSHWNMGSYGKGWTPQYQVQLLDKGHHILPWLAWPQGDPDRDKEAARKFG